MTGTMDLDGMPDSSRRDLEMLSAAIFSAIEAAMATAQRRPAQPYGKALEEGKDVVAKRFASTLTQRFTGYLHEEMKRSGKIGAEGACDSFYPACERLIAGVMIEIATLPDDAGEDALSLGVALTTFVDHMFVRVSFEKERIDRKLGRGAS